jgi:uncharacterized protein (DUF4415 family)
MMNTTENKEFDYQAYMKEHSPAQAQIHRGLDARQKRREVAKTRITIRVDAEIVEQFKQMVPEGRGYQSLINQALHDWLAAQSVKALLKEELPEIFSQTISSIQTTIQSVQSVPQIR